MFRKRTTRLTTLVMQPDSPVTESRAGSVRRLFHVSVLSGVVAGLIWFAFQYSAVVPLIQAAEVYEAAEHGHDHHHDEWQPAEGWQRNSLTAAATVLTSIGFAAILLGTVILFGRALSVWQGALWGCAGFLCFNLAPALGLPPVPPGVPVADLSDRQLWWLATAVSTATGLWLVGGFSSRKPAFRVCGLFVIALPHLIGAPAIARTTSLPPELIYRFTAACLAGAALFWISLGTIGGFIWARQRRP
jgi:cobalt transporter subunit CbtA